MILFIQASLFIFQFTVCDVRIQMEEEIVSVDERSGTVDVCAEITALPGELQIELTVGFFTTNGSKAGSNLCS